MKKILLTNDDGYNAEGIRILYEKLQKYGEVVLVAPHNHMSGASVSRVSWYDTKVHFHEANIYSVDGTPADAVHYALYGLKIKPDLIVSGINDGHNIGLDTIYSGTVGAAMEGLKGGYKAIAFSCDFKYFEPAVQDFDQVMDFILSKNLPSYDYILNVNFISRQFTESKGIIITDLAFRPFNQYYVETEKGIFRNRRNSVPYEFIPHTDTWAAEHGYTSITPLKLGNQTDKGLAELKKKVGTFDK
jgi:5'-nucleotidase